jgi:molybdopterin molybdotransferase
VTDMYSTKMYPMLSVEQARERVLSGLSALPAESIPILSALGRVLAQDVEATYDIPPYANSAMDGYAIQAADTARASKDNPARLRVVAELAAGYVCKERVTSGTAIRIMTGAPIPFGADAVVRFERTHLDPNHIQITQPVAVGDEVRSAGEDVHKGDIVLRRGQRLRPQDIGMLASIGKARIEVTRRPQVGVLATGDELVSIDAPLAAGKIRNSNSYSTSAQVLKYGGEPVLLGIASDKKREIRHKIRSGIEQGVDLLLVSGGVSVGDFDMVKKVLATEGEIDFWQVRMKPGKPLAFGHILFWGKEIPVLGTPGNPVSTMISFEIFARPMILALLGAMDTEHTTVTARLADSIAFKDDRRHFLRVMLDKDEKGYVASLTGDQGSGILTSMVKADGLAIVPEEWSSVDAGTHVQVILLGDRP